MVAQPAQLYNLPSVPTCRLAPTKLRMRERKSTKSGALANEAGSHSKEQPEFTCWISFAPVIQFNLLLSPYLCFISFLYLDLYVLGDDTLISKGSFMQQNIFVSSSTSELRVRFGRETGLNLPVKYFY